MDTRIDLFEKTFFDPDIPYRKGEQTHQTLLKDYS